MSKALTDAEIITTAHEHGIEPAALKAVIAVESGGTGYLPDGRVKILFEGHILWKRLQTRGISPQALAKAKPSLCFPSWTRAFYRGGAREWERVQGVLDWASENAPTQFESYKRAAYESCSWGLFQLMGFHYAAAGYPDVYALKHALEVSEAEHLAAILRWMGGNGLLAKLQDKDWVGFTRGYNGLGQVPVYSARLAQAYRKAK